MSRALELIIEAKDAKSYYLDLGSLGLTKLPPQIVDLASHLTELTCSGNSLSDISVLAELTELTDLDISHNLIESTSPTINLDKLNILDCSANRISKLEVSSSIIFLNISDNRLNDISNLPNLTEIQILELGYNNISVVPDLTKLKRLESINLSRNYIHDPKEYENIVQAKDLSICNLEGNNVSDFPFDILGNVKAMRSYFEEIISSGSSYGRKIKLMVVGNGRVGKSSVLYSLINSEPSPYLISTHGIDLFSLSLLDKEKNRWELPCWDFGGQEVYHATHRLMFSHSAIYMIVWTEESFSEEGEFQQDLSYWLDLIRTFCIDAHIVIVKNKVDIYDSSGVFHEIMQDELNRNIQQIKISAKALNGEAEFKTSLESIKNALARLVSDIDAPILPHSWVKVEDSLNIMEARHIAYRHYESICRQFGIKDPESLLKYLEKSGRCLYLEDTMTVVLNQSWIIENIYLLFDSSNGEFSPREQIKELSKVQVSFIRYIYRNLSDSDFNLIISYMLKTGIAFHPKDHEKSKNAESPLSFYYDKEHLVFPSLLKKNESVDSYISSSNVSYRYKVKVLHRLVIESFIIKTSYLSEDCEWWYNGIKIYHPELHLHATILAIPESNLVEVHLISNDVVAKRKFVEDIKATLEEIPTFIIENEMISIDNLGWVDIDKISLAIKTGAKKLVNHHQQLIDPKKYFEFFEKSIENQRGQSLSLKYNASTNDNINFYNSAINYSVNYRIGGETKSKKNNYDNTDFKNIFPYKFRDQDSEEQARFDYLMCVLVTYLDKSTLKNHSLNCEHGVERQFQSYLIEKYEAGENRTGIKKLRTLRIKIHRVIFLYRKELNDFFYKNKIDSLLSDKNEIYIDMSAKSYDELSLSQNQTFAIGYFINKIENIVDIKL